MFPNTFILYRFAEHRLRAHPPPQWHAKRTTSWCLPEWCHTSCSTGMPSAPLSECCQTFCSAGMPSAALPEWCHTFCSTGMPSAPLQDEAQVHRCQALVLERALMHASAPTTYLCAAWISDGTGLPIALKFGQDAKMSSPEMCHTIRLRSFLQILLAHSDVVTVPVSGNTATR